MDNDSLWTRMIACLDAHDPKGASPIAKELGDRLLAGGYLPDLTREEVGTVLKWLAGLTEGKEVATIEYRSYLEQRPRRETRPKWCELPVIVEG